MTPAICPACQHIVRKLLDLRAVELIIVEPEPWIDEDGREHWAVHPAAERCQKTYSPLRSTCDTVNSPVGAGIAPTGPRSPTRLGD